MTFTASEAATQGFQFWRYTTEHEVIYVPGDPGDTYTKGDIVVATVGEGIVDPAAASEVGICGTVVKTVTCPAATTAFVQPKLFDPVAGGGGNDALIGLQPNVPKGVPIYLVSFAAYVDDTVISYSAASRYIAATTGNGADDRPNGAIVYVYEGPGIGEVNVVEDYDHTGGTVELMLVTHRPFAATLTSASKYIVLAGEAASSRGVGFFNRIDVADQNNVTTADGADNGPWVVYLDWRHAGNFLRAGKLPVISAAQLHMV